MALEGSSGARLPALASDEGNEEDEDHADVIGTDRGDWRESSAGPPGAAAPPADADDATTAAVAAADSTAAEAAAAAAAARREDLDLVDPSTLPMGPLEFRLCCSVTLMLSLLGVLRVRNRVCDDGGGESGGGVCAFP